MFRREIETRFRRGQRRVLAAVYQPNYILIPDIKRWQAPHMVVLELSRLPRYQETVCQFSTMPRCRVRHARPDRWTLDADS